MRDFPLVILTYKASLVAYFVLQVHTAPGILLQALENPELLAGSGCKEIEYGKCARAQYTMEHCGTPKFVPHFVWPLWVTKRLSVEPKRSAMYRKSQESAVRHY
ncbi:hypothetical protein BDV25DRAFT_159674 [Aspergillus avenaceus]|uniref:Uncharacterized protein n=1 Tax=Aspergillus avenaceus TaxID=36643 RepID=A0A5N6TN13_ASPAV|nr:hypothetical protein BDV25DRAFT_159674 [Aspergillus avenaceus]